MFYFIGSLIAITILGLSIDKTYFFGFRLWVLFSILAVIVSIGYGVHERLHKRMY